MNNEQARALVKSVLADSFDRSRFRKLVVELFDFVENSETPPIPERFKDTVNAVELLNKGDGAPLVFEVQLAESVSVERQRSLQRNFIAQYLTMYNRNAALAGFWVAGKPEQWRLSFLRRDLMLDTSEKHLNVKTIISPVRRFSYLVGFEEQTHTAQQQFLALLTSNDKTHSIGALQRAFDVEPVSKEFFNSYRQLFDKMNGELSAFLNRKTDRKFHFEQRQIDPTEFAKRVLAQIVFLYFLQRKGWLGVPRHKSWGSGDRHFLRKQFEKRKKGISYFRSFLQPLFYEALAEKWDGNFYDEWGVRIPFLNGGLFEPWRSYDWRSQPVDFHDRLFSNEDGSGVLDIFDRYNFTVQEDDPVECEVAVDPEILGKVFEYLIEENRRHASGAYYTPRSVVFYMCQEVLIDYLAERHPQITRDEITIFVCHGRRIVETQRYAGKHDTADNSQIDSLPAAIVDDSAALDSSLRKVTICDPAVGSGAFPLGMLNVIVNARMALDEHLDQELTEFKAKFHAINHSLYGVDYDGGAVEIAKLRLWLSLVVDERNSDQIQPLPNLDYKMMQGNSLITHLNGKPLIDRSLLTRQLFTPSTVNDRKRQLRSLEQEELKIRQSSDVLTSENRKKYKEIRRQKKILKDQIANIQTSQERPDDEFDLLTDADPVAKMRLKFLALQKKYFTCTDTEEKRRLRTQIDKTHDSLVNLSIGQDHKLTKKQKIAALNEFNEVKERHKKPFFLWQLNFNLVFAESRKSDEGDTRPGGFDIVIGNPPYVKAGEIDKAQKDALKFEMKDAFLGLADLYTYFYFVGLKILRPGGHLTYITSKTFMRGDFGKPLRSMLAFETQLVAIVDLSEADVFGATTNPAICSFQNLQPNRLANFSVGYVGESVMLSDIPAALAAHSYSQAQETLGSDRWLVAPPSDQKLMAKLRRTGETVGDYTMGKMHYGVKTGLNEAFFIDTETRNRLVAADPSCNEVIKPLIEGKDIGPWNVNQKGKWIIVFDTSASRKWPWSGMKDNDEAEQQFASIYPTIHEHLHPFRDRAMKRSDKGKFWWELRSCTYYSAFERAKIVWGNLSLKPGFASDENKNYVCAPAVFIESDDLSLLAVLNSSVCDWFMRFTAAQRENGFFEYKPMYVSEMPMPDQVVRQQFINERETNKLIQNLKKLHDGSHPADKDRVELVQRDVNRLVYDMFSLDKSEIEIIERAVSQHSKDRENEMNSTEKELPIPMAATFEVMITFPNLNFDHHNFSELATDFSKFFRKHVKTTPAVWSKTNEVLAGDEYWSIEAIHIKYEESSWKIKVQMLVKASSALMVGAGTIMIGYGTILHGRAAMTEAVGERFGNHAIHSSREAANDVVDKYCPIQPTPEGNESRLEEFHFTESKSSDGGFYDTIEEANASLIQPEQVESAPQSNRNNELHILIRGDIKERFTIDVHPKRED